MSLEKIPTATYRLQMNASFTFVQAEEILPYLSELGISDCYLSPITEAKIGSQHGYDVVRFDRINLEIGTQEDFIDFLQTLKRFEMGLILDLVSNHMSTNADQNPWWKDVLMYGKRSRFASYFDIEWNPPDPALKGKVLLPILAKVQRKALVDGDLDLTYEKGVFYIAYYDRWIPVDPETWPMILNPAFKILKDKLSSKDFPTNKEELDQLYRKSRDFRHVLNQILQKWNRKTGTQVHYRKIQKLMQKQPFRLSFWQTAYEKLNYRRFFDINELAGIRQENPSVFFDVHHLFFRLIKQGWVTGIRIDHIDGIADPYDYLKNIEVFLSRISPKKPFVVIEKILSEEEEIPSDWHAHGTTGYDFLNLLNGLFVKKSSEEQFEEIYRNFTGKIQGAKEVLYRSKEIVLHTLFQGEIKLLTESLLQAAKDYGVILKKDKAREALMEIISCFSVYRTYIRPEEKKISARDQKILQSAISLAKGIQPKLSRSTIEFISDLFFFRKEKEGELSPYHEEFIKRFQQITAPVMAKGVEDTSFYRRYPLSSLNEVGAEFGKFGVSLDEFYKKSLQRLKKWPFSLSASYTHDTKRSEDTRARLNVLSEIPKEWKQALFHWKKLNEDKRVEPFSPDANEEYLIYQSLIGTWPLEKMDDVQHEIYLQRIDQYMKKAIKEAKIHTSWVDPDDRHEKNIHLFLHAILNPQNEFYSHFTEFVKPTQKAGLYTALSQLVLKTMSPGIPDFYQGSELWNFRLVDPDNRHTVNFEYRKERMKKIKEKAFENQKNLVKKLMEEIHTGDIKMYMTMKLLELRYRFPDLFQKGSYHPIKISGKFSSHIISFSWEYEEKSILVVTTRFFMELLQKDFSLKEMKETCLHLPKHLQKKEEFVELFTGKKEELFHLDKKHVVDLSEVFMPHFPFAVWIKNGHF